MISGASQIFEKGYTTMMYKHVITGETIDEERFDELVDEEMESRLDEYFFERWIDENYNAHEIFSMCEMERQDVYEEFYEAVREETIEDMDYEPMEEEEEE